MSDLDLPATLEAASLRTDAAGTSSVSEAELHARTEFAWKIFAQHQELIRAVDQKTYNLIVMSTLLVSLGSANVDRFVSGAEGRQIAVASLVASAVIFFLISLGTLVARTSKKPGATPSLIYFGDIKTFSVTAYRDAFNASTPNTLLEDLLAQSVTISKILAKKMTNYQRSWMAAMLEVGVFMAIVVFGHMYGR